MGVGGVVVIQTSRILIQPARGPEGLCAESARAVAGRLCPHSGEGEDFLMGQLNFLKKTAVTPETESRKIDPKVGN